MAEVTKNFLFPPSLSLRSFSSLSTSSKGLLACSGYEIRCDGYGEFLGRSCLFRVKRWRFKEIVVCSIVDGNTVISWRLGKMYSVYGVCLCAMCVRVCMLVTRGSLFSWSWMVRGKRITTEIARCWTCLSFGGKFEWRRLHRFNFLYCIYSDDF